MSNDFSKYKIALVIPNTRWKGKRLWLMAPQYALILTAILKKDFNFSIVDCNGLDLDEQQCIDRLRDIKPHVVLTSGMSVEYHEQVHMVMEISKKTCPEAATVLGGVYPTVMEDSCLEDKNVDYIFLGHAEERLDDFLKLILSDKHEELEAFSGIGIGKTGRLNPLTKYIVHVKKLSSPDYSLLDLTPYLILDSTDFQFCSKIPQASIITSRGCPYNCVFCASRTVNGKGIIYRKVDDILTEVEFLINKYGIQKLLILDDSFISNRKRAVEILKAFIDRKYNLKWNFLNVPIWHLDDEILELMKLSGCVQISVSIESGCQRVLDEIIHKPLKLNIVKPAVAKCREIGIDIIGDFIIGLPGETWDEIRQTFRFAEEMDFDLVHFHIATPQPKTDLYRLCKEKNLLPIDFSFKSSKYFGFAQAFIDTEEFTAFELKILRAFEWDRINFSTPKKIKKVADIYNMTVEHLNEHRKQTRLKLGVHCDTAPVGISD
jgi:radical SAM superfamily enzyme YgiQ (UPF0313 family)